MMTQIDAFLAAVAAADDERAEALCQALSPAAESTLLPLTSADSADLRWWAVRALAECGTVDAISPLVTALRDNDPGVRAVAARALSHLHARFPMAVCPQLAQIALLLTDADGLVRQSAADALALCGNDAVPVLAAILDGTALNITAPNTAGRGSTDIVLNAEGARSRAAQSLHKIATIQAAPVLYRHLEDPNHLVRTHAYEALDKMGLLENTLISLS